MTSPHTGPSRTGRQARLRCCDTADWSRQTFRAYRNAQFARACSVRPNKTRTAINCTSRNRRAAIKGFADAGSDGINPPRPDWLRPGVKDMVTGAVAWRSSPTRYRGQVTWRCTPTTAPRQVGRSSIRPLLHLAQRVSKGGNFVPVAHVGRLGSAIDENPAIAQSCSRRRRPLPRL